MADKPKYSTDINIHSKIKHLGVMTEKELNLLNLDKYYYNVIRKDINGFTYIEIIGIKR